MSGVTPGPAPAPGHVAPTLELLWMDPAWLRSPRAAMPGGEAAECHLQAGAMPWAAGPHGAAPRPIPMPAAAPWCCQDILMHSGLASGCALCLCSLSGAQPPHPACHQQHGARSWAALKWGWCCRTDFGGQAGSVWFMVTANAKLLRCHRCHGGPWRRMLMVGCVELLLAHPPAPSHTSGPVCAVESSEKCHGQSVFARGWGRSSSCEAQMTFGRGSSHCSQA